MKNTNNLAKLALDVARGLDVLNGGCYNSAEFDTFVEFLNATGWHLEEEAFKYLSQKYERVSMMFVRGTDKFQMELLVHDRNKYNSYDEHEASYSLQKAALLTNVLGMNFECEFESFDLNLLSSLA